MNPKIRQFTLRRPSSTTTALCSLCAFAGILWAYSAAVSQPIEGEKLECWPPNISKLQEQIEFCKQLKRDNDLNARVALGYYFDLGLGVPRDEEKAFELYLGAAKDGHSRAKILAGNSYALGRGTVTDPVMAHYWFRQAAKDGEEDGKRSAEAIKSLLVVKYNGLRDEMLHEDDIEKYVQNFPPNANFREIKTE